MSYPSASFLWGSYPSARDARDIIFLICSSIQSFANFFNRRLEVKEGFLRKLLSVLDWKSFPEHMNSTHEHEFCISKKDGFLFLIRVSVFFFIIPSAPITIGIVVVFKCYILTITIFRSLYFECLSNSFFFLLRSFYQIIIIIIIIISLFWEFIIIILLLVSFLHQF